MARRLGRLSPLPIVATTTVASAGWAELIPTAGSVAYTSWGGRNLHLPAGTYLLDVESEGGTLNYVQRSAGTQENLAPLSGATRMRRVIVMPENAVLRVSASGFTRLTLVLQRI